MKPRLEIIVPGPPVPCARPRATARIGRDGKPIVHIYTPSETTEYEDRVALYARRALATRPSWRELSLTDVKFRVHLHFVVEPGPRGGYGDLDNYEKAALDGLKKANDYRLDTTRKVRGKHPKVFMGGIFRDDRHVSQKCSSMYVAYGVEPRTEVTIETASAVLDEPLWMRCAREAGWGPAKQRPVQDDDEPTIPVIGDCLEVRAR